MPLVIGRVLLFIANFVVFLSLLFWDGIHWGEKRLAVV